MINLHKEIYQDIIDYEFLCTHYSQLDPTSFVHALCIEGHEYNSNLIIVNHINMFHMIKQLWILQTLLEIEHSSILYNGCTVSVMPKKILHSKIKFYTSVKRYHLLSIWLCTQIMDTSKFTFG